MKARSYKEVKKFQDIPNIGPSMANDFKLLGLKSPGDLKGKDPFALYKMIGVKNKSKSHTDPCVLDTYMAAIDFMNGAKPKPWWHYTRERKKKYPILFGV